MASITDKITDVRNTARPNSARVTVARAGGGTTLDCNSLVGWPTASKVHFVTYQIDSNSNPVIGTQLDCYGIVVANSITTFTVIDGTDGGNSVGDVVEMLPTAAWGQDLADALSVGHTRTGAHKASLPLTTPVIADFSNATHTHTGASSGGQLGRTSIDWSTFSNNIKSAKSTSNPTLINGSQDLASCGLSLSFTSSGTSYALVTVSLGIVSINDFELQPEIRLGGVVQIGYTPAASLGGTASGRAFVRGFTYLITLVNGVNIISAGVTLSSATSPTMAAGGGTIAAIVFGNITA